MIQKYERVCTVARGHLSYTPQLRLDNMHARMITGIRNQYALSFTYFIFSSMTACTTDCISRALYYHRHHHVTLSGRENYIFTHVLIIILYFEQFPPRVPYHYVHINTTQTYSVPTRDCTILYCTRFTSIRQRKILFTKRFTDAYIYVYYLHNIIMCVFNKL